MTYRRLFPGISALIALLVVAFLASQSDLRISREAAETEPPEAPANTPMAGELSTIGISTAGPLIELETLCNAEEKAPGNSDLTPEEKEARANERDALLLSLPERLAESSSAEHLYVAAIFEHDPRQKAELLKHAVANAPTSSFLVWGAFEMCSDSDLAAHCPMESLEQQLINADGGNSEAWSRIAANRFDDGEHESALEAMQYAATSAVSRTYWPEAIEAVERTLAVASELSFQERAAMAFRMELAYSRSAEHIAMCEDMSGVSVEWAHVCLRYGQLVEQKGVFELNIVLARYVQAVALAAMDDTEGLETVEERMSAHRKMKENEYAKFTPLAYYLIISNPDLFHAYLSAVRSEGQTSARNRFNVEVARLVEEQPELACVPEEYLPAG